MLDLTTLSAAVAVASSLVVAGLALARRNRDGLRSAVGLGALAFAFEAAATLGSVQGDGGSIASPLFSDTLTVASVLVPLCWALWTVRLAGVDRSTERFATLIATSVTVVALALTMVPRLLDAGPVAAAFEPQIVAASRRLLTALELLLTIAVLAGLEASLRRMPGHARARMKWMVGAVGGIFLIRFYLLSQEVLFWRPSPDRWLVEAMVIVAGNVGILLAFARHQIGETTLRIGSGFVYRSITVAALGVYLLVMGSYAWLVNVIGIPHPVLWGSGIAFAAAVTLAAVLLSERLQARLRRFVGRNFYHHGKYDYREQWIAFTERMSTTLAPGEVAVRLLDGVVDTLGARQAALYALVHEDSQYKLFGAVGVDDLPIALDVDEPVFQRLTSEVFPLPLDGRRGVGGSPLEAMPCGSVAVPLRWGTEVVGLMLVGPEGTGTEYTFEDLQFLATVARQAAGALVVSRTSQALAAAQAFEALHQVTSFVVHDLKNSVSALSMLIRNGTRNFDEEFRRDSVRTLSRTVDRMRKLIERLGSPSDVLALRGETVDLTRIVIDSVDAVRTDRRIRLVGEFDRPTYVVGDGEALGRVLDNLLKNAVEALKGQGEVTVAVRTDGDVVTLTVRDTGAGISVERLRHGVFVPFRSTKPGGWGIGLYQSKEIVARHGGTIHVSSRPGEGTIFSVRLPAARSVPAGLVSVDAMRPGGIGA